MKYLFFLFLPFLAHGQQVKWESSLAEAFRKAAEQDRTVFVEFYSPGCPYCQRIAPFFGEKAVADLYNGAFVNYALNVETEEAREFVEKAGLEVYAIPYFLFFRPDTTLVHAREVSADLNSVLQPGRMVVAKTYTGENYARRFEAGERSENFLMHYALFSRVRKDTVTNRKVLDALWEVYPADQRTSPTSWAVVKKVMTDAQNRFAGFWLENWRAASAYESSTENVKAAFLRIFHGTVLSREAAGFTAGEWRAWREKFAPVVGEQTALALTWTNEIHAYFKVQNTGAALELARRVAADFQNDAAVLTYLAQVIEQGCPACREEAASWRGKAKVLEEENASKENRK